MTLSRVSSPKDRVSSYASVMWGKHLLFFFQYSMGALTCQHPGSTVCTMENPGISEQHFLSPITPGLGRWAVLDFYLSSRKEHGVAMTLLKSDCLFTEHISLISVPRLMNLFFFDERTHDSFWMFLLPRYPRTYLANVTPLSKHLRVINELCLHNSYKEAVVKCTPFAEQKETRMLKS